MQKKVQDEVILKEIEKNNNSIMMSEGLSDIVSFNKPEKKEFVKELLGVITTESGLVTGIVVSGYKGAGAFKYKLLVNKTDIIKIENSNISSFSLSFDEKYINTWEENFFNITYMWENSLTSKLYSIEIIIKAGD